MKSWLTALLFGMPLGYLVGMGVAQKNFLLIGLPMISFLGAALENYLRWKKQKQND